MKNLVLLSILTIVFLTSCSDEVHLAIDNPTEFSIVVVIDTLKYTVPPKDVVRLEIPKGEHQITLENDSIIKHNFIHKAYMINPSFSEYLLSYEYYGPKRFQDTYTSKLTNKEVRFIGITLEGNYDIFSDVINKVTWDYGPREPLPKKVEIDEGKSYTSILKVYDSNEFMELMMSTRSGED
ncbi:hypothetical protein [Winogradskyella forsetii]|uniref:hypothetical protein n=1 Tax=Winogradskyella forsetii TaxID=2686077 RepID=UPI0015BCE64A|nr:hypothetical protein [Winogradskyella forsetii]